MVLIADQPRTYKEGDPQYIKVQALKTFLEREEHEHFLSCNNLIALYGEWGSGKSSIFKTLKRDMNTESFIPLIFEAWKYEKDDNLAFSLLEFILAKLPLKEKKFFPLNKLKIFSKKTIINELKNRLRTFSNGVTVKLPLIDIDSNKFLKQSLYLETEKFIEKLQKEIDGIRENKKILVMIDELDRCDDENIINLLSALKLMFSIKNIIFICGIDKEAVIKTLEGKYQNHNKAEEYLEKIFPISFNVVKYSNFDYEENETNNNKPKDYFSELKKSILEGAEITNPRKFNKAMNKYNFLIKIIDRKKIIDNFFKEFDINTKIKKGIEMEQGTTYTENEINLKSSAQLNILKEYLDILIKLYLFIKIILFESFGIEDIFILEKIPSSNDYIVIFNETINIKPSFYDNIGNKIHSKTKKVLKKIDGKTIMVMDMEKVQALVNITWSDENYQGILKLIIDEEIEKYY